MTRDELIKELQSLESNCEIHIVIGNEDENIATYTDFCLFQDKSEDGYTELYIPIEYPNLQIV